MEMGQLFIKIFIAGICSVLFLVFFRRFFSLFSDSLKHASSRTVFKDFIADNIFDPVTIKDAVRHYISPDCQDIRPGSKKNPKKRTVKKRNLVRYLDLFLESETGSRNLVILADSGMGKTCLALNYYMHYLKHNKGGQPKMILVPLRLKDADDLILKPRDKENSILFLDGFDEDPLAFDNPPQRLRQLIENSQKYLQVIMTCTPDFFPKDKDMPVKKGHARIGPEDRTQDYFYEFKQLFISPMTHGDIRRFLGSHVSFWQIGVKKRINALIAEMPFRTMTPLMLFYLKRTLKEDARIQSMADLYENIVALSIRQEHNWKDKKMLRRFLNHLAMDLYLGRKDRGEESLTAEDLTHKVSVWGISLHPFEKRNRSLIRQNAAGSVFFAHRSIMEFLFVRQLVSGNKACFKTPLTRPMGIMLTEILENTNPSDLRTEFDWLSRFELSAHGLAMKSAGENGGNKDLMAAILRKNTQFHFMKDLDTLVHNPIFFEFGWEPGLDENLNKAIYQSKPSLMRLTKKNWTVLINPKHIEITKRYQENTRILISKTDYKEYRDLSTKPPILKLFNTVGLKGIIKLNTINQSKNFCVLPDLQAAGKFTLYFWSNQFN